MKKLFKTVALGLCLILSSGAMVSATNATNKPEPKNIGQLKVHFIDIGQTDAILIQQDKTSMLIDAGNNEDSKAIEDYLKKQGVKKLDYVIGTHPHEDHVGSLDTVIHKFEIGTVIIPKVEYTSKTYTDVLTSINNKKIKTKEPKVGDKYTLGNAEFTIIAPNSKEYVEDKKDTSTNPTPKPETKPTPNTSDIYITKTGKKYHLDGCNSLAKSKIKSTLEDVIKRGLTPCEKCKPPIK